MLRLESKLVDAKSELLVCVNASCPAMVRRDCETWLAEVEAALPTVVFTARNEAGDLVHVRILVDGVFVTEKLDGLAVPIDPGTHRIRAETVEAPPQERTIVIAEGQKRRLVDFVFAAASSSTTLPPTGDGVPLILPGPVTPLPPDSETPTPHDPEGPAAFDVLLGPRLFYLVPGGNAVETREWEFFTGNGVGIGIDAALRVWDLMVLGARGDFVSFTPPEAFEEEPVLGSRRTFDARSFSFGILTGILPSVQAFSFWGDMGLGYRKIFRELDAAPFYRREWFSGVEWSIQAGVSIPVGAFRLVPSLAGAVGHLTVDNGGRCESTTNVSLVCSGPYGGDTYTFGSLQLALYYDIAIRNQRAR